MRFTLKKYRACIIMFLLAAGGGTSSFTGSPGGSSGLVLWFTRPASSWENALPVGNGRLGAMVFGDAGTERLQLNEETVWTGKVMDYHNPESLEGLRTVRQLLFEGKHAEAEQAAQAKIMGRLDPSRRHSYQTLGDLHLDFGRVINLNDYRRELDLENAMVNVRYTSGGVRYTREIFSSAPDQVLVIRLTADKNESLSFTARFSRPGNKARFQQSGGMITMSEHVGDGAGVFLVSRLKVLPEGGIMTGAGDSIRVEKADRVTLLLSACTDYRKEDPYGISLQQLLAAESKDYESLKKAHVSEYRKYFSRVDLDLGRTDAVFFPTDARIDAVKNGYVDPQLVELYFQFGRYLLISSSRPGCLPANLQGIWADGLTPPWSADYHINVNIQMNYWLAEVANLSEMHVPFLEFIEALRPDARKTAGEVYGCKGIVAHYTTDVWHFTEPTGAIRYGMWPWGLAWSCRHLWEHYLFSEDRTFLDTFAYPIMREAAEFVLDWLVEDPATGFLVSGPSISPENRYLSPGGRPVSLDMGPAMDHMIIRDLLTSTIEAAMILGTDQPFRDSLRITLERLAPLQVGKDGRLLEWSGDFAEADPGHRHISHLYGLHPGSQISMQQKPELVDAARKTIDYRLAHGGVHTGWSRAWIINFLARLRDGEAAWFHILELLRKSTLHNLFDTHPPFQIDGNFGAAAGICEMLLQSHTGTIELLPAIPSEWENGYVHGLRARGGFILDIDWKKGQLNRVTVYSKLGNNCRLSYQGKEVTIKTNREETFSLDKKLRKKAAHRSPNSQVG